MQYRTPFKLSVLALMLTGLCCATSEAADTSDDWTFNLYFENDLFAESDQNYTNGLRASWVSPDIADFVKDDKVPNWLRRINRRLTFFHAAARGIERRAVVSVGQTIYTPNDIDATGVIKDQRPYAGWLFGRVAYLSRTRDQLDTIELSLGMIGPAALGQESQDFVHELRGFKKFQGWDNQLSNELGLMALYEHRHRLVDSALDGDRLGYDLISHTGLAMGNVAVYTNAGLEMRFGWGIPSDFGTSAVRSGGDNFAPASDWRQANTGPANLGLHLFALLDAKLVAHDIFLDGNTFRNSHSVDKEYWVGETALGVSLHLDEIKISYAQIYRSREFKKQDRHHSYGSLSISVRY